VSKLNTKIVEKYKIDTPRIIQTAAFPGLIKTLQ